SHVAGGVQSLGASHGPCWRRQLPLSQNSPARQPSLSVQGVSRFSTQRPAPANTTEASPRGTSGSAMRWMSCTPALQTASGSRQSEALLHGPRTSAQTPKSTPVGRQNRGKPPGMGMHEPKLAGTQNSAGRTSTTQPPGGTKQRPAPPQSSS